MPQTPARDGQHAFEGGNARAISRSARTPLHDDSFCYCAVPRLTVVPSALSYGVIVYYAGSATILCWHSTTTMAMTLSSSAPRLLRSPARHRPAALLLETKRRAQRYLHGKAQALCNDIVGRASHASKLHHNTSGDDNDIVIILTFITTQQ